MVYDKFNEQLLNHSLCKICFHFHHLGIGLVSGSFNRQAGLFVTTGAVHVLTAHPWVTELCIFNPDSQVQDWDLVA